MTPQRAKRRPVFDPSALDDDLDELLPKAAPQPSQPPLASATAPAAHTAMVQPSRDDPAPTPPQLTAPALDPQSTPSPDLEPTTPAAAVRPAERARLRSVSPAPAEETQTRYRPPEVLLSAEVYDALYQLQIAEKKTRRGLARPMGAIVLDAIEKHVERLQTTWEATEDTVGEGGLFVRPSSSAVPRRRRHAVAPRTVVLSGVSAPNGHRLDALVDEWGAGTRSALVEQALRYEFNLT